MDCSHSTLHIVYTKKEFEGFEDETNQGVNHVNQINQQINQR